jgi:hypothetical protein
LLLAKLAVVGRQTVAQVVLVLAGGALLDWSAWYRLFSRQRIAVDVLTEVLLAETLVHAPPAEPYVVGVDATHIPRSSRKLPFSGWMRAPGTAPFMRGIRPGQRFVHCAFLPPVEAGYSRAIPLRFTPAPPPSAARAGVSAVPEWQAGLQAVQWVRVRLNLAERRQQLLLVLADGAYDTVEWWRQLPAHTCALVRTAKNAALYTLPPPRSGRGQPRKYGERAPTPQEQLHLAGGWQRCTVEVRGRSLPLRYQVTGPVLRQRAPERPLFLLVVSGATYQVGKRRPHTKERPPAYYLVSAVADGHGGWQLPLPAKTLLAWARCSAGANTPPPPPCNGASGSMPCSSSPPTARGASPAAPRPPASGNCAATAVGRSTLSGAPTGLNSGPRRILPRLPSVPRQTGQ